jgi:hypothetical protein
MIDILDLFLTPLSSDRRNTMPRMSTLLVFCLLALHSSVLAQGEAAVPFLLLPVSARSNGMGGAGTALVLDEPLSIMGNPAQLGSFSLHGTVALAFTPSAGAGAGQYAQTNLKHTGYGFMAGYRLDSLVTLPFRMSAGIGYTHNLFDYGTFMRTSSEGPDVIGTFEAWERANGLTLGIGLEYGVRLGIGGTLKWITSNLSPIGTEEEMGAATAEVTAHDFGTLLEIPVADLVIPLVVSGDPETGSIKPVLDLSASYALSNVGDEVVYIDPDQADPLPRNVTTAVGLVAGVEGTIHAIPWNFGTIRWTRQGEDLLVTRHGDGTFEYRSGLGDMKFADDVLLGKENPKIAQKTGWEVELFEFVAFRGGNYRSAYGTERETSGFGIRLAGIVKAVHLIAEPEEAESWLMFLVDHVILQWDTGTYDNTIQGGRELTYSQITLMLKGFPW